MDAKMLGMNRSAANPTDSPPRRFILLPEEKAEGAGVGPRIRRYQLTRVGRGAARRRKILGASEIAMARIACDLERVNGG